MSRRSEASVPLLKTCQTCFHAKIRCDKTQDSGLCDRCLRLGKTCVFAPARRRNAGRRSERREGQPFVPSRSPSTTPVKGTLTIEGLDTPLNSLISQGSLSLDNSFNPFHRELLTYEKGQELLDIFRTKMTSYFPFVVVPEAVTVQELARDKPTLCLAILSAASNTDMKMQRKLAVLFNELIAVRMITGRFTTIEVLQGLLVHLAWAHFLPRPRRYSQHLHLAMSIISDLRLEKPRRPNFWTIEEKHKANDDWSNEDKRALAGIYYLSSSTSVLLQKCRHIMYTPYIFDSCQTLAEQGEYRSDKYLPYIIHLQKLTEDVDDIVTKSSNAQSVQQNTIGLQTIRERYTATKSSLPFSLSDSPTILLQLNLLDLLISQSDSDGTPFGMNKFQNIEKTVADQSRLLDWLSQSISASKSLMSVVLVLPHGEEGALPNIGWIMMYCGVSLAVRLDLLAAHPSISPITQHLRRILDMPHTLRQIVLRLEAAGSRDSDPEGEWGPFSNFARRGKRIEQWYLQNCKRNEQGETAVDPFTPAASTAQPLQQSTGVTPAPYVASNDVPSIEVTSEPDDFWAPSFMTDLGTEFDLSSALFTESFDFFNTHQF